jgi:hypothetical protein
MSLDENRRELEAHAQILRGQWERVCELWDDPVRQRFEELHWDELDQTLHRCVRSLDHLISEIERAHDEIES